MAGKFPTIQRGTKWWETHASEWRRLVEVVERLDGLTPGRGIEFSRRGRQLLINARKERTRPTRSMKRVAVVSVEEDHLLCREVRYADSIPVVGRYAWYGSEFVAYPELGRTIDDYESAEWGTDEPTTDASILHAYRLDGSWFVLAPVDVGALEVATFLVKDTGWSYVESGDVVWCSPVDGPEYPYIAIGKPDLLLRSVWDGRLINEWVWDWTSPTELRARWHGHDVSEKWTITPPYREDYDRIYALKVKPGFCRARAPAQLDGEPVEWMDLNIDGRTWAKQYEDS